MNDLDKARKWAESIGKIEGLHPEPRAAVEVIQSLPDQWVDAEKLREVVSKYEGNTYISEIVQDFADLLPAPPLPTLEGLSDEERLKTKWGQADHATGRCVIVTPHVHTSEGDGRSYDSATLMWPTGRIATVPHSEVTPLPDLPRLEWPGSAPDDVAYATGGALTTQDVVDECRAVRKERALPRPEDVPPGEPWLVMNEGCRDQWVGTRDDSGTTNWPWILVKIDGTNYAFSQDVEVTLVSRLVTEVTP